MAERPLDIVPLEPWHLEQLAARPRAPQSVVDQVKDAASVQVLCSQISYAALRAETVVAAAGVVRLWPGRAAGWFYKGEMRRRDWPAVTRAVEQCFEEIQAAGIWRVEIAVMAGFQAGYRWAHRLGFKVDCRMEAFLPDGGDAFVYSRVFRSAVPG